MRNDSGAWKYLDHWRATEPADFHAVDILWFRLARQTGNMSLIAPVLLVSAAIILVVRVLFLQRWLPRLRLLSGSPSESSGLL